MAKKLQKVLPDYFCIYHEKAGDPQPVPLTEDMMTGVGTCELCGRGMCYECWNSDTNCDETVHLPEVSSATEDEEDWYQAVAEMYPDVATVCYDCIDEAVKVWRKMQGKGVKV